MTYRAKKLTCSKWGKFWFWVQFDLEGQGQSPHKTIGILTKVFYISGPNLVILAWTVDELSCGQAHDWRTHGHTHTYTHTHAGNDNTRRPKLAPGKNPSENVVWKKAAILSQPQCFNPWNWKNVHTIIFKFKQWASARIQPLVVVMYIWSTLSVHWSVKLNLSTNLHLCPCEVKNKTTMIIKLYDYQTLVSVALIFGLVPSGDRPRRDPRWPVSVSSNHLVIKSKKKASFSSLKRANYSLQVWFASLLNLACDSLFLPWRRQARFIV